MKHNICRPVNNSDVSLWYQFCKNITFILYIIYNVRYNNTTCQLESERSCICVLGYRFYTFHDFDHFFGLSVVYIWFHFLLLLSRNNTLTTEIYLLSFTYSMFNLCGISYSLQIDFLADSCSFLSKSVSFICYVSKVFKYAATGSIERPSIMMNHPVFF
jgi:hypothetical protein